MKTNITNYNTAFNGRYILKDDLFTRKILLEQIIPMHTIVRPDKPITILPCKIFHDIVSHKVNQTAKKIGIRQPLGCAKCGKIRFRSCKRK